MDTKPSLRQIVLDTETTGLEVALQHRIIEIGAVEIVNRKLTGRHYHQYIKPDRAIDAGALEVHGITEDFLADKPRFEEIADEFLAFVEGAEVVIHNAAFDVAFLDHEFKLCRANTRMELCCEKVTDSLALARKMYPGQRNSLDALCRRLDIDNSHRKLHGALLDSEILAEVFLMMTGGQSALSFDVDTALEELNPEASVKIDPSLYPSMHVISANPEELKAHEEWIGKLEKEGSNGCVWSNLA
ncbi:DNA polymerase III subunit epsilon [Chromatiales bacterium (ex Bugula neritina AB1)]|nr:DNA polymerase III subunit epsilon [Chromatiales bacterium (ex Bugula neritina AB1)]